MTEAYKIDLKCNNCKRLNWNIAIPVGTTIKEFGEEVNIKCPHCNCNVIKVKEKKEE